MTKQQKAIMKVVYDMIDELDYIKPYNPSQGEEAYAVVSKGSVVEMIASALADNKSKEFSTMQSMYRILPSLFADEKCVIYKFKLQ